MGVELEDGGGLEGDVQARSGFARQIEAYSNVSLKLTASTAVLPVREVISQGPTVRNRMWTSGWLEEKKNRSGLKTKLWRVRKFPISVYLQTYGLECIFPVCEVQRSVYQTRFSLLIPLGPAFGEQVPFWLEIPAQCTSKS